MFLMGDKKNYCWEKKENIKLMKYKKKSARSLSLAATEELRVFLSSEK